MFSLLAILLNLRRVGTLRILLKVILLQELNIFKNTLYLYVCLRMYQTVKLKE